MDFNGDFSRLSLEQLQELVREIGPLPSILREIEIRFLMQLLPGLGHELGKLLTAPDLGTQTFNSTNLWVERLVLLMVRNAKTTTDLEACITHISAAGLKPWSAALRLYAKHPSVAKVEAEAIEQLLLEFIRQTKDDEDTDFDGDAAEEVMTGAQTKDFLRREYGLTSAFEYRRLLQSMKIVIKQDPTRWQRGEEADLNAMVRKARKLYERARSYDRPGEKFFCSPAQVHEFDLFRAKKLGIAKNALYKRPDGEMCWGDGKPVIYDKDGNPRRPMESLLGGKRAAGSDPATWQMEQYFRGIDGW